MRTIGYYESIGETKHFIPYPLPPKSPPFTLTPELTNLYGEAMHHLGKLNEMAHRLPDIKRFINAYVIKEALLSSSIEGIHTSLIDVFTQPLLETRPNKNTQLVMNYKTALDAALVLVQEDGLPISSRVILKAHERLMQVGQGERANPGHYRKQSVRVGNLIPAPAPKVSELMGALEQYINTLDTTPTLIKAGFAHVQFEMIHPFIDGNGRIGRLLIVLMLVAQKVLSQPILYPSYYFKKHHLEYYHLLDRVRTHGDFEGWIQFYLTVIKDSGIDAYRRVKDIEALQEQIIKTIKEKTSTPKGIELRIKALTALFNSPIINVNELKEQLDTSYNTANQIIIEFVKLGILAEETQQKRGKLFKFIPYLAVLEKEYS
jgi:Fic family protein